MVLKSHFHFSFLYIFVLLCLNVKFCEQIFAQAQLEVEQHRSRCPLVEGRYNFGNTS